MRLKNGGVVLSRRYIVYRHTAPSGKSYIGITTKSIRERIRGGYNHNIFMKRAIEKYGWENITTEIISDHATREEASLLEAYYIESLETRDHTKGYNIEEGGVKRKSYSEETRRKISEAAKKRHRPCSEETRVKLISIAKGKAVRNVDTGEEYSSAREAFRQTGISYKGISAVCHGYKKHAGGFRWEFVNGTIDDVEEVQAGRRAY